MFDIQIIRMKWFVILIRVKNNFITVTQFYSVKVSLFLKLDNYSRGKERLVESFYHQLTTENSNSRVHQGYSICHTDLRRLRLRVKHYNRLTVPQVRLHLFGKLWQGLFYLLAALLQKDGSAIAISHGCTNCESSPAIVNEPRWQRAPLFKWTRKLKL